MSTITKHQLKTLRDSLPHKYTEEIRRRINNEDISDSLIFAVINGEKKDYYGIIKAAIKWSNELKIEQQEIQESLKEFTSNN